MEEKNSVGSKMLWNSDGGTVRWNSGTVLVEQRWWNSDGGIMWWKKRTVLVEQCCGTVMVEL